MLTTTYALSPSSNLSAFFKKINLSSLTAPTMLALKSGNFSVKFFNDKLIIGQSFLTKISKTFIFPSANGTLSSVPGASSFLKRDLATSASGEIITSIGKLDLLYSYNWPGNIRELRNLIERVTILSLHEDKKDTNKLLTDILKENPESLHNEDILNNTLSIPLKEAREQFETNYLINQLRKNNGNISKTADFIGMERSALHRKLKSLGIKGLN